MLVKFKTAHHQKKQDFRTVLNVIKMTNTVTVTEALGLTVLVMWESIMKL